MKERIQTASKDPPELSGGLTVAKRRVQYILGFCGAAYLYATKGWDMTVGGLLSISGLLFVLYEGANYWAMRRRSKIWSEGISVDGRVLSKRELPLGVNGLLELAYTFDGVNYNTSCEATDKQFYRLQPGANVRIRVHPAIPTHWIIEETS